MRPLRKDLIPWLLDNPRTVGQIAREYGVTLGEIADDLRHLVRSLRHTDYRPEITPAQCRKCGFTFSRDKLLKPSRCPACRSSWLSEPQFCVRRAQSLTTPLARPGASENLARQDASGETVAPANPPWLESLDHTADAGFALTAPDLPRLFERAAWGMFSLICDLSAVRSTRETTIEVEADDEPAMLVRWLSELNFHHVTEHQLYRTFVVTELTERRLRALAGGEPIDPGRHTVYTEIKAVTFHGLEVRQAADGWHARVIFDL